MDRNSLVRELFPEGVPTLWCPTITHFASPRVPDRERIARHLASLRAEVSGLLVPGSTGEGWSMGDEDILGVLDAVLDAAFKHGQKLLIGVLKRTAAEVIYCMERSLAHLYARTGASDWRTAFSRCGVVGFTVCPPTGEDFSQERIRSDLASILSVGYPTALYQLPQVTNNEMSAETVASLAAEFPNFFLFKDTSGRDRVASSGVDLGGLFLVRGAEGSYASWTKGAGGPYDGFLLSTANVFAPELGRILRALESGDRGRAESLALSLDGGVGELFTLAGALGAGNPFANANKLVDHLRAWGDGAEDRPMPLLYGGERLPAEWVALARGILRKHGLGGSGGAVGGAIGGAGYMG